jgi:hypothetical protein
MVCWHSKIYVVARANTPSRGANCDQRLDALDNNYVDAPPYKELEVGIRFFSPKVTKLSVFRIEITFLDKQINLL